MDDCAALALSTQHHAAAQHREWAVEHVSACREQYHAARWARVGCLDRRLQRCGVVGRAIAAGAKGPHVEGGRRVGDWLAALCRRGGGGVGQASAGRAGGWTKGGGQADRSGGATRLTAVHSQVIHRDNRIGSSPCPGLAAGWSAPPSAGGQWRRQRRRWAGPPPLRSGPDDKQFEL